MDNLHKIREFLSNSPENQTLDTACDLLIAAQKEIAGLWYLVKNQDRIIVNAQNDLQIQIEIEQELSTRLFSALGRMCASRGIKPEDLDEVCDALEHYDTTRSEYPRDTYLKWEEQ